MSLCALRVGRIRLSFGQCMSVNCDQGASRNEFASCSPASDSSTCAGSPMRVHTCHAFGFVAYACDPHLTELSCAVQVQRLAAVSCDSCTSRTALPPALSLTSLTAAGPGAGSFSGWCSPSARAATEGCTSTRWYSSTANRPEIHMKGYQWTAPTIVRSSSASPTPAGKSFTACWLEQQEMGSRACGPELTDRHNVPAAPAG